MQVTTPLKSRTISLSSTVKPWTPNFLRPVGPTSFGRAANRDSLLQLSSAPGEAVAWLTVMESILIGNLSLLFITFITLLLATAVARERGGSRDTGPLSGGRRTRRATAEVPPLAVPGKTRPRRRAPAKTR